jgi:hypothetical protein
MLISFSYKGASYINFTVGDDEWQALDIPEADKKQIVMDAKWEGIRIHRNKLISGTDNYYLRHHRELRSGKVADDADNPTTLSNKQLSELDAYVQLLADIPQIYASPDDVVWPEEPVL